MTCTECRSPSATEICADCARENAMFAAWRDSIEVPAMTFHSPRPRNTWWLAAAAAAVIAVVIGVVSLRRVPPAPGTPDAAAHYRRAIARAAPHAASIPFAAELDAAIRNAERTAEPGDPIAVAHVVAAYDAKLQLMRRTAHD